MHVTHPISKNDIPSTMIHPEPWWLLLLLLLLQIQLVAVHSLLPPAAGTYMTNHTSVPSVPCSPEQSAAILRLKRSFSATDNAAIAFRSWRAGTDCYRWEGVRCGHTNGLVTSLDLGDCGLVGGHLDPTFFELTSLWYLNLGGNDFNMSQIPSMGFEKLTKLIHLNLSTCNFSGPIPNSIGRLTNLVTLDLSFRSRIDELYGTLKYRYVFYLGQPGQLKLANFTNLVAKLSNLRELHLSFVDLSNISAEWCHALAKHTPNLRVLSLPFCRLSSPICESFFGLQSLSVIDLHDNYLTGPVPDFFANFSSLSVLQLSYNSLEGWVSPLIFQNKKLVTIDLHHNSGISGNLPNFPADSNIEIFNVSNTNFSGTIPSSISNLKSLKKLGLGAKGFVGELPLSIGKIKSLNSMQVSGYEIIGMIPSWITNLTSLEILDLSHCGLYGPIPSAISNLKNLRILALYDCNFYGKIPPSISNLTQLDTLVLSSNNLVGTVELNTLWKFPNLSDLDLSNNNLNIIDGEDNSSLISFPSITFLSLESCNITNFPNILRHLNDIDGLDLSNNHIHGAIPEWAWEKWTDFDLFFLNFSHNKFTKVGYDTFLPFSTVFLDLSFNMFDGSIPIPQNSAAVLDYSYNQFSSMPLNISTQLGDTVFFKASGNKLSGRIPSYFCSTNIEFLDLSYNTLNGSIPSCLMEEANALQVLNLKGNQLHGELPHNINESCTFEALDFSDNQIEGQLPRSLAYCKKLEVLAVGNNKISDSFPCWMTMLPTLQVLVLKSNKFFGQVLPSVAEEEKNCELSSLRILDLASNNFSGTLTDEWFAKLKSMIIKMANKTLVMEYEGDKNRVYQVATKLTYKGSEVPMAKILRTFVFIDVSNNAFHGSVPRAVGELVLLKALNMSHNSFTGLVPFQLGHQNQPEVLDLSSNKLSGEIPQELASLDFLTTLNMSNNMLEGRIPESPHFSTFSNSSFMGNPELCGPPLSKQCNNETSQNLVPHHLKKKYVDVMMFLFAGLGFGIGFAVAIVVVWVLPIRKSQMITAVY